MGNYVIVGENDFAEELAKKLQTDFIQVTSTIFPDTELKIRMNNSDLGKIGDRTALVVIRARRYEPNPNDCVLLWGSSIWEWFDPLSLIRAMKQVAKVRDDVKLFFMSRGHPNPQLNAVLPMEMYGRAVQLSRDLGLIDRLNVSRLFGGGWHKDRLG